MNKIKELFLINESYKTSKIALIIILISALLSYNLLIIHGLTNPDGVIEGLYYYNNAYVASTMSGRWFVRYLVMIFAGIVNPLLNVLFYSLCIYLSLLLFKKIFPKMTSTTLYLSGIILIINPIVITQFTYLYMSISYGLSALLITLFIYLNIHHKKYGIYLASLPLAFTLGLYQSYIGMAMVLVLMYLIYELINNKYSINDLLKLSLRFLLSAILGIIIYFIILKIDRLIYPADAYNRIAMFSLNNIISNLGNSLLETYKGYFNILFDPILKRRYLYGLLLIIFVITLILHFKNLLKQNKIINIILILLFILLIPLFSNIIKVLIPNNELYIVMKYQVILIIPFILIIIDLLDINKYLKYIPCLLVIFIAWGYMLSANATYKCYELSYRHYNSEYQMILNDIYDIEEYEKDKTPIIIVGFVDDYELRKNNYLYHYAIELPNNLAFWEDYNGITYNRYHYFLNYFGVNPGVINADDYKNVVHSDYFKSMPVWPKKDSVIYKDGKIIVKLTNDPVY